MRRKLLANHLGCDINSIKISSYKSNLFEHNKNDYLVLTHQEANEEAKRQINDSLWSLDASLIQNYLKTDLTIETIEHVQSEMCENCTFLLLSLLINPDVFYKEIIELFGRGHFLAFHDGKEHAVFDFKGNKRYYIYRLC